MGASLSTASVERARDALLLALHTRFADTDDQTPLSVRTRTVFERVDGAQRGWIASPRLDSLLAELGLTGRWDRRQVDAFAQCFALQDELEPGDAAAARTSSRLDYLAFLDLVFYPIQAHRSLKITQQAVVSVRGWMVHEGEFAGCRVTLKELALDASGGDDNNARDDGVAELRRRINALRLVSHPNLVRYATSVQTAQSLFVVQEAHPSCTLRTILESFGPMKEATIRRYVSQVLEALSFLHGHDILHGNLDLETIHIDSSGLLKLSEFGASGEYRALRSSTQRTSFPNSSVDWIERFPPPEQARSKAADVWAVGVLILQMTYGLGKEAERALGGPVGATTKSPTTASTGGSHPPLPSAMSKSLRSVVEGCLKRRVRARLTANQVCSHEFFQVDVARATREMLRDVCSDLDESMQRLTSGAASRSRSSNSTARGSAPQVRAARDAPPERRVSAGK